MQVKPGYKRSDLGPIPEDWDAIPLGHISDCLIGLTYSPLDVRDFGTLVLRSSNIQGGRLAFDDCVYVEMEVPPRAITRKNDILICVRNGSRQLIGKCALIDESTAGSAFGAFMSVLRSESAKFLFFQFQSDILKRQINEVMGATINQITNRDMASFKVIWPPTIAEQEAIAEALSDADALIESLDQLIAKKRQIKQGAMQELLTGKRRLAGFSGEWVFRSLGEICSMKSGFSITGEAIDEHSPFPCYGGNGLRGFTATYTHDGRYGLIGRQGALCGNVVCVKGQFFASEHAIVVTPKSTIDIDWLTFVLRRMNLNQYSESSAQPGLSVSKLKALECDVPPYEEQTAIAIILSDMDTELTALESRLAKARQIKQGMMQELLTGRIRLLSKQ